MYLEIITPDHVIFKGEVISVKLPGKDGYFEVLDNHAPLVAVLQNGEIRIIKPDSSKEYFEVSEGFAEVLNNKVTVLV